MPVEYTEHSAGPSTRAAQAAADEAAVAAVDEGDYSSYTKAQLVEAAEAQGLDTSGTKADLLERLSG